jgi:uncharacterized protein
MTIQHTQLEKKGYFFVGEENNRLAEMTYTLPFPNKMIIEHTEVSDALRGQNVGYQLVDAAVEYARANNIKIIPLCPFANSVFKKKPELQDVLSPR